MADKKDNTGDWNSEWKKVTKTFRTQGGAKRAAAAITVSEHGKGTCNVESTDIIYRTAIARGIDPSKGFLIDMAVNEKRELIGVWATAESTPGTSAVRLYKKGASTWVAFHLGGAFAQAPKLRPNVKRTHCLVSEALDGDGLPIMVIPIKAGLAMNTQSREDGATTTGSKTQSPGPQTAASKDTPSKDTPSKDAPAKDDTAKES